MPQLNEKIPVSWRPFTKIIWTKPKIEFLNLIAIKNIENFQNYLEWCDEKVEYKKIISECVQHKEEILKPFYAWNSKLVPFYLVLYHLNDENKKQFKFFKFHQPENCYGQYLSDQLETNFQIYDTYNQYYNHDYTFIPKGISDNQLITFYNQKFDFRLH